VLLSSTTSSVLPAGFRVSRSLGRTAARRLPATLAAKWAPSRKDHVHQEGSITSFQASITAGRRPDRSRAGHDLRPPRRHLVLERSIASWRIYPAVDPLASTSAPAPEIVGQEHYDVARRVQQVLQRYKTSRTSSRSSASTALAGRQDDGAAARKSALPEPAVLRGGGLHRREGNACPVPRPSGASRRSWTASTTGAGRHFYMKGGFDEVKPD